MKHLEKNVYKIQVFGLGKKVTISGNIELNCFAYI